MEKFEHGDDDEHSDEQRIGQRSGYALADGDAEFKGKDAQDHTEIRGINEISHGLSAVLSIYFAA